MQQTRERSEQPAAVRHRHCRSDQNHLTLLVRKAQHQHLTDEFPDLLRRKVDDARDLPPDEASRIIVFGDLRRGAPLADLRTEIDPELERRLAGLRIGFGPNDGPSTDVYLEEVIEGYLRDRLYSHRFNLFAVAPGCFCLRNRGRSWKEAASVVCPFALAAKDQCRSAQTLRFTA